MKKMNIVVLCILIFGMIMAGTALAKEAKITKPLANELVTEIQVVNGTSKDITNFQNMWIVVQLPSFARYYPQDKKGFGLYTSKDGKWSTQAAFGGENDSGRKYQLLVTLVDDKGNKEITSYLDNAKKNLNWSGMDKLPAGTSILDNVTVIRK
jgi:hypothetical protein